MQTRCVGKTDIVVSMIGLGTVKFGRNQGVKYPHPFSLPSDKEIVHLLSAASDLGINLLDTAPAYGSSEERLGTLLRDRHRFIITTKVGEEFINGHSYFDFSKVAVQKSIDRSLKRLQTDYLDIVLVHSNGEDERLINQEEIFVSLASLKAAGKIRAFGLSCKSVAGGMLTIDHADLAMVACNVNDADSKEVIKYAHSKQKGIFIKKALASGHLQTLANTHDPIKSAMQFIFDQPGVTSVVIGTLNPAHLRENVEKACDAVLHPLFSAIS